MNNELKVSLDILNEEGLMSNYTVAITGDVDALTVSNKAIDELALALTIMIHPSDV